MTPEHLAALRAGAARGDQNAILALAQVGVAPVEAIEVGTTFLPSLTPRVDGREVTVDVTDLR